MKYEFDMKGKVSIITGGSRGIGKEAAVALAGAGSDIVVASRKIADLEQTVREIESLGVRAMAVATHLGHPEEIKNLVNQAMEKFGHVDVLVNNAASNPAIAPTTELEERTWDHIMNVNLKGTFLLTQLVGRQMIKQGKGKIVNVSSVGGIKPGADGLLAYETSKAALIMMTKMLAKEWGKYGLNVNAVAPGLIETSFSKDLYQDEKRREEILSVSAIKRLGKPEDVAALILFLACPLSDYMTGQTVVTDGGRVYLP